MPKYRHANLPLRLALLLTSFFLAAPASWVNKVSIALECPPVLATSVVAEKYPGWSVYSNDPLRLTGADIAFVVDHEDGLLDPDKVS